MYVLLFLALLWLPLFILLCCLFIGGGGPSGPGHQSGSGAFTQIL
jgi:hypothetical protein